MSGLSGVQVLAVTLSTSVGGTDHSIRTLARALLPLGVTVTLGGPGGTATEKWWRDGGLPFLSLDLPQRTGIRPHGGAGTKVGVLGQVPKSIGSVARIREAVRPFDVLHSNHLLLHADAVVAARSSRKPVVVELHDIVPVGVGRTLLSIVVGAASRTVAVSNAAAAQLSERGRARTHVVHQGVDSSVFSPGPVDDRVRSELTDNPGSPLIAAIGRVDPEKKLDVLIDAVARVREQGVDAHLAIVGSPSEDDGSYLVSLREQAERLLPGAHRFLGRTADVASVLRSIDVLAIPSKDEPFGLIALEAQACAVPVVSSDSGGLLDFVIDERTGLVAKTGDAASLARQLERSVTDRALIRHIVGQAQEQVSTYYSAELRARRFSDIYSASLRR